MRRVDAGWQDPREAQADELGGRGAHPTGGVEVSAVRDSPTQMAVLDLAQALHVHPAIAAG